MKKYIILLILVACDTGEPAKPEAQNWYPAEYEVECVGECSPASERLDAGQDQDAEPQDAGADG